MTHDEVREALFEAMPSATPRRVETALRWAVYEFFSKIPELVAEQILVLVPNVVTYSVVLASPSGLRPVAIKAAMMGGRRLVAFSHVEGLASMGTGARGLWLDRATNTVKLTWRPAASDEILVVYHLAPATFADTPAALVDHHGEALIDGAKSQMFGDVGRPYTNLTMAAAHSNKFIAAIRQRRRESLSGNVAADLWVPPLIPARSGPKRV